MIVLLQLAAALSAVPVDSQPVRLGPVDMPVGVTRLVVTDTVPRKKRKAIEVSDEYETRLKIHQFASYATVPLFAAQIIVGQNLYNADHHAVRRPEWATNAHKPIAYALGGLFAVNSVTGAMNWWETRHQEQGRTWRTIHAALMLAADAGFAYTGSLGGTAKNGSYADEDRHRTWAIASSSLALASYTMMLSPFRKD